MIKAITVTVAIMSLLPIAFNTAKAQPVNPDSAAYYLNLGKAEEAAGRNNPAWGYFDKAAKYDPQNADIQIAIADICLKMPRKEATGIRALEAACRLRSADYLMHWKLISLYYRFGQYDSVIDLLPRLSAHHQETPGWADMLGKSYYYSVKLQDYSNAIRYLEIGLKDDPDNSEAAYLIGRIYAKMENYQSAATFYKRTLETDSTSQPSRTYEFAVVLYSAKQYDASVNAFSKALERNYKPRDDFFEYMAEACVAAAKTDMGIDIMKELIQRHPRDIGLLNGLAEICYSAHRYKEAQTCWDKVMEIAGEGDRATYARALYQIGSAYDKMGNSKDANQLRDRAIEMDPSLGVMKRVRQGLF